MFEMAKFVIVYERNFAQFQYAYGAHEFSQHRSVATTISICGRRRMCKLAIPQRDPVRYNCAYEDLGIQRCSKARDERKHTPTACRKLYEDVGRARPVSNRCRGCVTIANRRLGGDAVAAEAKHVRDANLEKRRAKHRKATEARRRIANVDVSELEYEVLEWEDNNMEP